MSHRGKEIEKRPLTDSDYDSGPAPKGAKKAETSRPEEGLNKIPDLMIAPWISTLKSNPVSISQTCLSPHILYLPLSPPAE